MHDLIESAKSFPPNHSAVDELMAVFRGLSWLSFVTVPWSIIVLIASLTGVVYLSMVSQILVVSLIICAVLYFIYVFLLLA